MSLAGRVSCSMLNCFVSPQAFIWVPLFVCESGLWWVCVLKPPLTRLPVCACWPISGGWGGGCVGRHTWGLRLLVSNHHWVHTPYTDNWKTCVMMKGYFITLITYLSCMGGFELPVCWLAGRRERGPVSSTTCKMCVLLRGTLCAVCSSLRAVMGVHCSEVLHWAVCGQWLI